VALVFLFLPLLGVDAYEIDTHALMSEHAFNAALAAGSLGRSLRDLGISETKSLQDDTSDITIPGPGVLPPKAGIPLEWLREGSRHEDDCPFPPFDCRPLNHFFDPSQILSGFCHNLIDIPSPAWGLAGPGTVARQTFSFGDSRQYFFDGLTGLDHGVGHFRPLSITRHRPLLAYHGTAMSHEDLCQVF
jgi:hypothetical protein